MSDKPETATTLLNNLIVCPSDNWEAGTRGFCKPEEPTDATSWAIYMMQPWQILADEDKKKERVKELLEAPNGLDWFDAEAYTVVSGEMATWTYSGLEAFRDTINDVLKVWDDFNGDVKRLKDEIQKDDG